MRLFGVKAEPGQRPVRFIDHLRNVWGISDGPTRLDKVEPGAYSTDIYSRENEPSAEEIPRRRSDWPY